MTLFQSGVGYLVGQFRHKVSCFYCAGLSALVPLVQSEIIPLMGHLGHKISLYCTGLNPLVPLIQSGVGFPGGPF